jgi:Sulfotransferase family
VAEDSTERRGVSSRPRLPVVAVNLIGALVARAGLRLASFDEPKLREAASREAKASDFGTDEYIEPMRVLLGALEHEARLNFVGRFAARAQIVTLLANRAKMQQWWSSHPEILATPVVAPWFVVGLPRSGTTLLQQLLACDQANRSLQFWEATHPAPPPERATYDSDPRIASARRAQRVLDYVAPDANAIHPVGATAPTECVSLLANSFASLEFGVINHVPSHVEWCLGADLRPHYRYFREQLQLLQWKCSAERWTLKSPAHLLALDALFETFPDAHVVWLHRDPITAVTSHCSLVAVLQAIGTDRLDLRAIGREWPHVWAAALERAIASRARVRADRFVDVHYDDLLADPVSTVRDVYLRFGTELRTAAEARMRAFVGNHPQRARGTHVYSPADFGFDGDEVRGGFAAYSQRFSEGHGGARR